MILPDVNVLIGGFRADSVHHRVSRSFLEANFGGENSFGISPLTLAAVTRITTNPRFNAQPSTSEECLAFAEAILAQPNCSVVEPGPRHWRIFADLVRQTKDTSNNNRYVSWRVRGLIV